MPSSLGVAAGVLLLATSALAAAPTDAPASTVTGEPALRDVLAAVLDGAPELMAFSAEVRAREARALQAGSLPNPELRTDVEDLGGGGSRRGFEQTEITVTLGQLVELGGKRARRRRLAELETALAGWDYETARLDALAGATKAFWATVAAQERVGLTDELAWLAQRSVTGVVAQVEAGGASPVEVFQARVAAGTAESARAAARNDLDAARASLAATWGESLPRFARVRGTLAAGAEPPPLETLLDAVDANPDLVRWTTEMEARHAGLALERARAIPDVTVGVGGRHFADDGSNAVVLAFSLPLPVFDRNRGAIREAEERVTKAASQRVAARSAARATVVRSWAELRTTWEQARLLRERMLPDAEAAYARAEQAYRQGLFRFLEVLDTQRTLFELRERQIAVLAAHAAAGAEIERWSGATLADLRAGGR